MRKTVAGFWNHAQNAAQLFASYAKVKRIRALAAIVGEEELSELDKIYLRFGTAFEERFLRQGDEENRSIIETLDLGWQMLSLLPKEELYRVRMEDIQRYYMPQQEVQEAASCRL